jgi:uncharacterized protein (DUF1697 family)
MVALLRGVNVGGRASLPMADLRAIATDLGFDDVATYIQSGNLVFRSSGSASTVADRLAAAIDDATEVHPSVLVRTRSQLAKVVAGSPFVTRGVDPAHLHFTSLDGPARTALALIDDASFAPEQVEALGRELHLHLPNGLGRSKLAAALARGPASDGTTRSWRTVTRLLDMADQIA